jgi:hypothetical protein
MIARRRCLLAGISCACFAAGGCFTLPADKPIPADGAGPSQASDAPNGDGAVVDATVPHADSAVNAEANTVSAAMADADAMAGSDAPDASALADTGAIADASAVADTGAIADASAVADTGAIADASAVADTGPLADSDDVVDAQPLPDGSSVVPVDSASTRLPTQWMKVPFSPGFAKSIGANGGSVWAIICGSDGCEDPADEPIVQYGAGVWIAQPGAAIRITVSTDGTPWVINAAGAVYEWNGLDNWNKRPLSAEGPCASAIAVGNANSAWIVGCPLGEGGVARDAPVYSWNASEDTWSIPAVPAQATDVGIATFSGSSPDALAGVSQFPFVISANETIALFNGTGWLPCPSMSAVQASYDAIVSADGNVYQWSENGGACASLTDSCAWAFDIGPTPDAPIRQVSDGWAVDFIGNVYQQVSATPVP